ncbi:hypothetical protein J7J90_02045 [Candidatus Micrarchaeota archaeon]|nr:hypothetical protein [Candidatus Micrarchaeota archaeon]
MKKMIAVLFVALMVASIFAFPVAMNKFRKAQQVKLRSTHIETVEILELGESMPLVSGYQLKLIDIGVAEYYMGHNMHAALMHIENSDGHVVTGLHMFPGESSTFVVVDDSGEHVVHIRVLRTTYGYELFQRWAEVEVS